MDGDGDLDIIGNCEEHYDRSRRTIVGVVWFENRLNEPAYSYSENAEGLCVIEAEHYTAMGDGDWLIYTAFGGYSGEGYLIEHHTEDEAAQDWGQSEGVSFEVELDGGEYEIWLRRWVPLSWGRLGRTRSNSVWLGVDGRPVGGTYFDDASVGSVRWTWTKALQTGAPAVVSLSPGRHVVQLQGREGGYAIDQIVLARVGSGFSPSRIDPALSVTPFDFKRDPVGVFFDFDAPAREGLWYRSTWLGDIYVDFFPDVLHRQLGWMHAAGEAVGWAYSEGLGWIWLSQVSFPFIYSAESATWLFFDISSGQGGEPLRLYNFATNRWQNI